MTRRVRAGTHKFRIGVAIAASAMAAAVPSTGGAVAAVHGEKQAMNEVTKPQVAADQLALLASSDPRLAANKRLVFDMYRIVLQAGRYDRAHEFIAENYIQHNPNAAQGLAGLVDYVRSTRPQRDILDRLELPLIHLMAEGDYVTIAFVRPEKDASGRTYYTTWFDMFRIENGKIAEHWDPMLRSDPKIDPNDKKLK